MIKSKKVKEKTKNEIMIENLRDIKEIFDKHNIKFWLDWGTLLGAIRGGKIIECDDDIDLGMMEDDFKKIYPILPEINKKGFFINASLIFIPKFFFLRSDYIIDIWPYFKSDKNIFLTFGSGPLKNQVARVLRFIYVFFVKCLFSLLPYKLKKSFAEISQKLSKNYIKRIKVIIPKHYFERFRSFEFYNTTFNVPFDAEGYLKYKYGESWEIPRQKWNWIKEDKSVKH